MKNDTNNFANLSSIIIKRVTIIKKIKVIYQYLGIKFILKIQTNVGSFISAEKGHTSL